MPYKLKKENDEWCVVNSETGESKGCSASHAEGIKHMRAMYANEDKELTTKALDELVEKSIDEKCYPEAMIDYVPWSVTSFAQLDEWKAAQEHSEHILEDTEAFKKMVSHIVENIEITDKESALATLASEFGARIKKPAVETKELEGEPRLFTEEELRKRGQEVADAAGKPAEEVLNDIAREQEKTFVGRVKEIVTSIFGIKPKETPAPQPEPEAPKVKESGLMLWKEADGRMRWIARYSNKFRDREQEILSSGAHQKFVEKIDKSLAPLPELWFWHRPEYKWGQATGLAYDDSGFTIATGYVLAGKEAFAEAIAAKADKLRVSHGMPKTSIVYDPDDPSVILEYETREISPLPAWAAANELTGFYIMKEGDMPVPEEKRRTMIEELGIKPEILDALETTNAKEAAKAEAAGIDSKELGSETPAETPVETPTETPVETPAETKEAPVTRQEIADAIATVIVPRLEAFDAALKAVAERVDAHEGQMKELAQSEENRLEKMVKGMAPASLTSYLARSVIGTPETRVDGRSELAKDKPKEAPAAPAAGGDMMTNVIGSILKEHTHTSPDAG